MEHRSKALSFVLVLGLLIGGAAASAAEGEGDLAAEMAAWQKVATPGEHHEHLARLAGTWTAKSKMLMQPDAPPAESTGTATNEMIMGGRFLRVNYEGEFMGQPFQGFGLDGFDNVLQKHTGIWLDNMGTMVMSFIGECSDGGKVLTTMSEFVNPMGEKEKMKGVTTVVSDNEFKYEAYNLTDAGEFRSMEIIHTRR